MASLALLSRGLHLDGLADLADGLGSGQPAAAALDIMRRSDIGPLGTVTLILTLLIQVAALSQAESAGHGRGPAALIAAVVTGRLALTWACRRGVPPPGRTGSARWWRGRYARRSRPRPPLAALAAAAAAVVVSATVTGEPLGWTLPLAVARRPGRRVRRAAARGATARRHHRRRPRRAGRGRDHRHPRGGRHGPAPLTPGWAQGRQLSLIRGSAMVSAMSATRLPSTVSTAPISVYASSTG